MRKIFSIQIIKQSIKSIWIWWLISSFVISINLLAFPSMEIVDMQLESIFVESGINGNGIIFITLCVVLFSNVFITSQIDRGTLVVVLNTPTTRKQIIFSKMLVFIIAICSICLFTGLMGSLSVMLYNAEFNHSIWWKVIILWMLYSFAIGGITFFLGCIFNKSKYTLSISSLLLGSFFIVSLLALTPNLEGLKYLSLQTLYAFDSVLQGKSVVWNMITLILIGTPLYAIGSLVFLKKDLPL